MGIAPISLCSGDVWHTIEKILTRVTTLLHTSSQLEICTQSYWVAKLREFQLWKFRDSHLGVVGQNAIWMWALWRGTKYTIGGKVVASFKSEPWWVLWVWVCMWFVLAPKVLQLCTNNLLFGLCKSVWMIKCLSLFLVLSRSSSMPRLLVFSLFSLQIHIWIYQGAWGRITNNQTIIIVLTQDLKMCFCAI